jgi:hypothetical protein
MDIRKVVTGWVVYVVATTLIYWLLFNGQFGGDRPLPIWMMVAAAMMAIAAIGILLWWVSRLASGKVSEVQARDYSGFFLIIVVSGVVGDVLTLGAEIAFGAAAVWMMIPISTLTYCLCVVWLYRRYFRPHPASDAKT